MTTRRHVWRQLPPSSFPTFRCICSVPRTLGRSVGEEGAESKTMSRSRPLRLRGTRTSAVSSASKIAPHCLTQNVTGQLLADGWVGVTEDAGDERNFGLLTMRPAVIEVGRDHVSTIYLSRF